MTTALPSCRFRDCHAALDPFSDALYCRGAHRSAEHRAALADKARTVLERRAQARTLVGEIAVATMLGDEARVLALVVDVEDLLAP